MLRFIKASFPILVSNESKVASYYDNIKFKDLHFEFSETSEKILNTLKGLNLSKAAGIDNLSGKFLKDHTDILARPINLSVKINSFPRCCQIAKVKPLFKKGSKLTLKSTTPFHYSPSYQKFLKGLFVTKHKIF